MGKDEHMILTCISGLDVPDDILIRLVLARVRVVPNNVIEYSESEPRVELTVGHKEDARACCAQLQHS